MRDHERGKANGLPAQLQFEHGLAARRKVALGKEHVQHPQHGLAALAERLAHEFGSNVDVEKRLACTFVALLNVLLARYEARGDLSRRETREGAQREDELGRERNGRVRTGVERTELFVVNIVSQRRLTVRYYTFRFIAHLW